MEVNESGPNIVDVSEILELLKNFLIDYNKSVMFRKIEVNKLIYKLNDFK